MSISYGVPETAVGQLTVSLLIPLAAEYDDTRNRIKVAVYVRQANVWVLTPTSGVWLGDPTVEHTVPTLDVPVVGPMTIPDALGQSMPLYDMRGAMIRVEIEVQRAMRVGVTVTSRATKGEP